MWVLVPSGGKNASCKQVKAVSQLRVCILQSAPPLFLKGTSVEATFEGHTHTGRCEFGTRASIEGGAGGLISDSREL